MVIIEKEREKSERGKFIYQNLSHIRERGFSRLENHRDLYLLTRGSQRFSEFLVELW